MTSIGEELRRRRVETGISLNQVSLQTKINIRLLEAIEADQFDKLPGGVFRRKFVLQYASALGLDEREMAEHLHQLTAFEEAPDIPGQGLPRLGSDMPAIAPPRDSAALRTAMASFAGVIVVMIACAGLYSWWEKSMAEKRPPVAVATPEGEAVRPPAAMPTDVPDSPPQARPDSSSTPAPADVSQPLQPVRVGLTAGEETWIQASSDGRRLFSEHLHANESKVVEATEIVRLLVGNAGGLEISLNGKPIGPIGSRGQVRVVELTQSGFQIVSRKPPTPEPL